MFLIFFLTKENVYFIGEEVESENGLNWAEKMDLRNGNVSALSPMIRARSKAPVVAGENYIIVFGGYDMAHAKALSSCELFDSISNR